MKTIPITIGFDKTKKIGMAKLDKKKLPKRPIYVFAIGGEILKKRGNKILDFELTEISLVPDKNYIKLEKIEGR